MILWCDGAHDPVENMRRDAALLARFDKDAADSSHEPPEPVLRLFRFHPHGITLGHAQRPERVLDLERCRGEGVPWAVRPTGGRAIFHAEEWTYSLSASIADPEWGGSLAAAYARVSALICASLDRLGVPAVLASSVRGARAEGHGLDSTPASRTEVSKPGPYRAAQACFASTARHEIVLGGRKLVGSAQRRTARALLQQGSLLLGPGHIRLIDYLASSTSARARARAELGSTATHAGTTLGSEPPLERWADALFAELPRGSRRLDGASGGFLLTLAEVGPYTPAFL